MDINQARVVSDAALSAFENFIDTCPDLEDREIEIAEERSTGENPAVRMLHFTVDGVRFLLMCKPAQMLPASTSGEPGPPNFIAMDDPLRKPIETLDDAKAWIDELVRRRLDFHFDDSPETIEIGLSGFRLWHDDDCAMISDQRDALYCFEWGEYDCPIGYMLAKIDERDGVHAEQG